MTTSALFQCLHNTNKINSLLLIHNWNIFANVNGGHWWRFICSKMRVSEMVVKFPALLEEDQAAMTTLALPPNTHQHILHTNSAKAKKRHHKWTPKPENKNNSGGQIDRWKFPTGSPHRFRLCTPYRFGSVSVVDGERRGGQNFPAYSERKSARGAGFGGRGGCTAQCWTPGKWGVR